MTTYTVDNTHSEITFTVRHMMFAKVRGHFNGWTASMTFDSTDPAKSSVEAEIDVTTIDTREEKRDGHLRSGDFFDTEKFPKMTFKSTSITRAGGGHYTVKGDLTIRDQTHGVELDVEQAGAGKDPWGNQRLGFSAKGQINRTDWGLKWNQALEAGGVLVSEKVDIDIEVQAIEKK